ncbi:RcnB family protein [Diaphorobacter aerolatus]|uniref:RcnB family protein n=1 Tax=Diaphorobacter aerolatus TaxID=1288495 RepID=A0A7H0GHH3_9BURK|nr:RcnB family protein [Diaphorobacter aerolatus]QNP47739.1 RcnB family protein [Diaphorobacter aerolatus]
MTAKIRTAAKTLTSAAVALVLGVAAIGATAQPRPDINRNDPRYDHRDDRRDDHRYDRRDDHRDMDRRHDHRRSNPPGHARYDHYPRGAGPDHRWNRGDRIPPAYRTRSYVVEDWRGHRLSSPPRGYQWVQYGGDYLLVAIATGVIASMILTN